MSSLFLIATIAGRPVAIESGQVESVVDIGTIVPVPRAVAQVRGLAALRSRVVTVIDAHVALGLTAPSRPAGRAVITVVEGQHYAVLVDSLEDVEPFDLVPLAAGIALEGGWRAAGCGIVARDGKPILALNLRALLPVSA
ncbi:chemotaxis protein CheW [Sphingomonas qilianensis]|uniref:Chemotaxis protein CheW n=1 Tax=Sphingomonas qilianensis TaxID=1736690 RepID=A0ABU9XMP8_9SPHN